ncbi:glycosyltransferase [Ideonella sp. TBM-1]|uniref:Glycosyltransferase n=1 Tax=Ideonella livida TaxID=2707176 RepID=A0A7C9TIV5_9BURK|nr:glycosyltransferase [Ideonella livida]
MVAIGRNEGERLRRCLESVRQQAAAVVYVDSGSTDGSVAMAQSLGVIVVSLDMRQPFTAARARNEGLARLLALAPQVNRVQFVDGDCEVVAGWLPAALAFLQAQPAVGVVCGRRRERHPQASIYNLMCDLEWDGPKGEVKACGGDALFRVAALTQVGGYRPDLIAGEEPELCVRLRAAGWTVWRLDEEMTLHDAAMHRLGQWWSRSKRCGYAYAQGAHLHGAPPERHKVAEARRGWVWGAALPLAIMATAALAGSGPALALGALYPLQVARLALKGRRSRRENWLLAGFTVVGKFAELSGQLRFHRDRLRQRSSGLIEYK